MCAQATFDGLYAWLSNRDDYIMPICDRLTIMDMSHDKQQLEVADLTPDAQDPNQPEPEPTHSGSISPAGLDRDKSNLDKFSPDHGTCLALKTMSDEDRMALYSKMSATQYARVVAAQQLEPSSDEEGEVHAGTIGAGNFVLFETEDIGGMHAIGEVIDANRDYLGVHVYEVHGEGFSAEFRPRFEATVPGIAYCEWKCRAPVPEGFRCMSIDVDEDDVVAVVTLSPDGKLTRESIRHLEKIAFNRSVLAAVPACLRCSSC